MKFWKIAGIGVLLFCITSGIAGSTEDFEHPIIAIAADLWKTLRKQEWEMCGEYFAKMETAREKIVAFSYAKGPPTGLPTAPLFIFTRVELIDVSIDDKVEVPTVFISRDMWGDRVFLKMNLEDYKEGLPCFSRGAKV
ncbi:MAG: hypothetical protein PHV99_02310 [Candidatus Pacebacteria bacterium]|nr:hypothetical protein [Candidatus Paceibacterota bacterium]